MSLEIFWWVWVLLPPQSSYISSQPGPSPIPYAPTFSLSSSCALLFLSSKIASKLWWKVPHIKSSLKSWSKISLTSSELTSCTTFTFGPSVLENTQWAVILSLPSRWKLCMQWLICAGVNTNFSIPLFKLRDQTRADTISSARMIFTDH
jgi:hypothetical protein